MYHASATARDDVRLTTWSRFEDFVNVWSVTNIREVCHQTDTTSKHLGIVVKHTKTAGTSRDPFVVTHSTREQTNAAQLHDKDATQKQHKASN
jgi:hypothetical protein